MSFSRGISGEMDRVARELVCWCRALEYQEHRGDTVARFGYTSEGFAFSRQYSSFLSLGFDQ